MVASREPKFLMGLVVRRGCLGVARALVTGVPLGSREADKAPQPDCLASTGIAKDDLLTFNPRRARELFELNAAGAAGGLSGAGREPGAAAVLARDSRQQQSLHSSFNLSLPVRKVPWRAWIGLLAPGLGLRLRSRRQRFV